MMNPSERAIARGILWSTFRCCTTAFERSIRTLDGVKVFHEYYGKAACFGEERSFFERCLVGDPLPGLKFGQVKSVLEGDFPGYQGVFLKDMALNLVATGKTEFVPDGYRHAFLIRNPTMSVPSLYRTLSRQNVDGLPEIIPDEAGIRDMWALYEYIRDVKGQTPMVIDADDDLLRDPATTMKKFCDFVGFEFKESMLRWTPVHPEEWVFHDEWYDTLLSTTGFVKNTETPSCPQKVDVSSYPAYVQDAIRDCKPYYEKLYKLRTT